MGSGVFNRVWPLAKGYRAKSVGIDGQMCGAEPRGCVYKEGRGASVAGVGFPQSEANGSGGGGG